MQTGLFQQQSLKLVMTKELTQAITLLQYSSLDLTKFLEEQTLENPLIDVKPSDFGRPKKMKVTKDTYINPIDYLSKKETTLYEHLLTQISYMKLNNTKKQTVEYIIQLLDSNGYLYFPTEEIARDLNIDKESIENAIQIIQSLDPIGVGARSLQECLLLQLQVLQNRNRLAETIIQEHFERFAEKSWKEIAKDLNVKLFDIQQVFDFIQTLKPRPGAAFHGGEAHYIVPDIDIQVEGDVVTMKMQDSYLPKVSLNLQYYQHFLDEKDTKTKSYLQEKVDQCQWIMRSLEQRKMTLQNVMSEIINRQIDFFIKGPAHLKPLIMSEVADALEIHESTVSRAVKDKFVQTPFGIFEMKYFFSRNIQTTGETDTSSTQVKNVMKQMIEEENKQKPLSDQEIVSILEKEHGILVSRRTIAKYRDQLNIPSSTKRKRYSK
ncbi:RNA polymerase factor sigma-54 [Fredinandcohnia sp. QZ13]|uniref:RNA polymerase factor sigma-54 n=1 Tax=Fredinandcohnia sp. QZ13 TaxID=3073144 RepID=UPI0028531F64|nr:RNA polymerase factor sigma-54 [Fredinandcohnia sp. QZ13]MDR4889592.1 RNA polymerase factor sigma-54 [Fredinandcohnia sp. QZ13]